MSAKFDHVLEEPAGLATFPGLGVPSTETRDLKDRSSGRFEVSF